MPTNKTNEKFRVGGNAIRVIYRLFELGHFNNPAHPTGVTKEDLPTLKLHDGPVRTALASFQEFMAADLDQLTLEAKGGIGVADGEFGPITAELFNVPRCGMPDYRIEAANGPMEANWPTACRGNLLFGRSFKEAPGLNEADTTKAFWGAVNNISQAISDISLRSADPGVKEGTRVFANLKRLAGSTLAWSYLARNNCRDQLEQAYDTRSWTIQYLCTVATHELLHAMGCSHVRDSNATMYPSIHKNSLARYGYLNTTDVSAMKALGYSPSGLAQLPKDRLFLPWNHTPDPPDVPDPPPTPEPPKGPNEYWFKGDFELMQGDTSLGSYILTPKPQV